MNDIAEGLGTGIEGALMGRVVDPGRGDGLGLQAETDSQTGSAEACPNCNALVSGKYCSNCGQKTHIHRSLSAIGHDLVHGVLHLDGKLWRTLPLLALKPGQLTRRYIDGERASFVSPMAMFLFSVFAMFAVFQIVGISAPTSIDVDRTAQTIGERGSEEANQLRRTIESLPEDDPGRAELEQELLLIERVVERVDSNSNAAQGDGQATRPGSFDLRDLELRVTGVDFIDQGIIAKWQENPSLMLYKLQANAYKFSWLLIPLSIPFVWLVFIWKRAFRAYDHAVFVTYSLSFMSLLFIGASVAGAANFPSWTIVIPLLLIPPVHLYKQLRGAYNLSRFSAFWRLMVLSGFIWVVAMLFLQLLLLLGTF